MEEPVIEPNSILPPPVLTPKQEALCGRLDSFYAKFGLEKKPSDMFKGAIFAAQKSFRSNPDWMSQAAHSIRDILFPFWSNKVRIVVPKKQKAFKQFGSIRSDAVLDATTRLYSKFTEIAHHSQSRGNSVDPKTFTSEDFEMALVEFEDVMFEILTRQGNLHQEIEAVLAGELPSDREVVKKLIEVNSDAHKYFFSKADEKWLEWLRDNGFLAVIGQKFDQDAPQVYQFSELEYLSRVSKNAPSIVADIIASIEITKDTHPYLVERFLWIIEDLPPAELKKLLPKVQKEDWLSLLKSYKHYGFIFQKILKKLAEEGDSQNILLLANILLAVKVKEKGGEEENSYLSENPFHFSDLEGSGIFEALENIEDSRLEEVLKLLLKTMSSIVLFTQYKREPREAFKVGDGYSFYDVDFFELETGQKKHASYRDDIRDVASTLKALIIRTIGKGCLDKDAARKLLDTLVQKLPDSQAIWRLKLFVLSLCPDVFEKDILEALFRIKEVARPHDITAGSEYGRLLMAFKPFFREEDKKVYIQILLDGLLREGISQIAVSDAYGIASIIKDWLSEEEIKTVEEYVKHPLDPDYKPAPIIGATKGGWMRSESVVSQEELTSLSVVDIVNNLATIWTPDKLKQEEWKEEEIISYDAEGVAKAIKENMTGRFEEYIAQAPLFFDRENLSPHYTYEFLVGVKDILGKEELKTVENWSGLYTLLGDIEESFSSDTSDIEKNREEESRTWLAGWGPVHTAIADLVDLLSSKNRKEFTQFGKHRTEIFSAIKYLLKHPSPTKEREKYTPREGQDGEVEYDGSDPYSIGLNSVRGKAFFALLNFIAADLQDSATEGEKLKPDVKSLLGELLSREHTQAMYFLFGRYLYFINYYSEDMAKVFIGTIFDFNKDFDLALAAWEGFTTQTLYQETVPLLENKYEEVIDFSPEQYTKRKFFHGIDESLADHLALAYTHFDIMDLDHPLIKKFWSVPNIKRHSEFVSFIGRHVISRSGAKAFIAKEKIDIEKIEKLWVWLLDQDLDTKVYESFGFWMDASEEVLDIKTQVQLTLKTLQKADGIVEWNHHMLESLAKFAAVDPEGTLKIMDIHFTNLAQKAEQMHLHLEKNVEEVFKLLYENPLTKQGTEDLINRLLPCGNGAFWRLGEILK